MKNLVTHTTGRITSKVFYRVVTPDGFSNTTHNTIEDAVKEKAGIGFQGSNKTKDQVKYWTTHREACTIVRVTETTKRVA
tara:strand:+ start:157 stop:396 length:240 start_codon:yes stop_codon:yes gene_type:complete